MSEPTSAPGPWFPSAAGSAANAAPVPAVPTAPAAMPAVPTAPAAMPAASAPAASPMLPATAPAAHTPTAYAPVPSRAPERVLRGTLFSLIVLPTGVALFVLVWQLGFIATAISFVISIAAFGLYSVGSGGRVSLRGAVIAVVVAMTTLTAAFFGAMASDLIGPASSITGIDPISLLLQPGFWTVVWRSIVESPDPSTLAIDALVVFGAGIAGCVGILTRGIRAGR